MEPNIQTIQECGRISMAAKRLGYRIQEEVSKKGIAYIWVDPMSGSRLEGPACQERQEALHAACKLIENSWQAPK
jgi:hypothetical protein